MYQLLIKIMYEQDFRKYTIKEIQEMKAILKHIKEENETFKKGLK